MRLLLFLLALLFIGDLRAQDEARIDSLESLLLTQDVADSARVYTLINLWRATRSNDLDRAEDYARQIIDEALITGYLEPLATGYQRLGITKSYKSEKDSTFFYYNKALDIYNSNGNVALQGVMLYNMAAEYQEMGHLDSALFYLEQAGERFATDGNHQRQGAVLITRSTIKREQSLATEALELAFAAREKFELAKDESWAADADQEIAFAYETLNDYASSLRYLHRAYATHLRTGEEFYANVNRLNIGGAHAELGNLDSSRYYLQLALEDIRREEFVDLEDDALLQLAQMEQEHGNPSRADAYYREVLKVVDPDDLSMLTKVNANYAKLLADENGDPDRAISLATTALNLSRQTKLRNFEATALSALSAAYARRNDYPTALKYHRDFQELQDSIYRAETTATLAELQTRYETERQSRRIEEQAARLTQLEQQQRIEQLRNRNLWVTLAAALLAFLAIAFSLYQRLARNRAEKATLNEKMQGQQRELSAHTLHIVQKNQLLEQLHQELGEVNKESKNNSLDRIMRSIQNEELVDQDWAHFKTYFQEVHGDYETRLRQRSTAKLSPRELRLAALIKMGLTNAEIGSMLNVSQESLYKAKYRLRKKLPAEEGVGLDEYLQGV